MERDLRDPVWKLYFALAMFLGTGAAASVWLERGREHAISSLTTTPLRDDPQNLRYLQIAAAHGSGAAMANLAYMHERGWGGLEKDSEAAWLWRRKAALEAGNRGAMRVMGLRMLRQDLSGSIILRQEASGSSWAAEGLGWIRKAAGLEDRWAMAFLGEFYEEAAYGLPMDWRQAASWYAQAGERKLTWAKARLGSLHERGGPGLERNPREALRLYDEVLSWPPQVWGWPAAQEGAARLRAQGVAPSG